MRYLQKISFDTIEIEFSKVWYKGIFRYFDFDWIAFFRLELSLDLSNPVSQQAIVQRLPESSKEGSTVRHL